MQLAGKLTREQVVDRYARAAVYVQPSRVAADGELDREQALRRELEAPGYTVEDTKDGTRVTKK